MCVEEGSLTPLFAATDSIACEKYADSDRYTARDENLVKEIWESLERIVDQ